MNKRATQPISSAAVRSAFSDLSNLELHLSLGHRPVDFIYFGHIGPSLWRSYLHTHSFFEVCIAYQGRGTYQVNGSEHSIGRGDLFIARPGDAHEIIGSSSKSLAIYFWAFTISPPAGETQDIAPVDLLLSRLEQTRQWVTRSRSRAILSTCDMLADEGFQHSAGYLAAVRGLATKLLLDTARAAAASDAPIEPAPHAPRSDADRIVRTALRYLRDNLSRPIGVRDVAAQVHLSERHLSRLFQAEQGQTLMDCLTAMRIEAASQMLLHQEQPIKQIAAAVGYGDVRYFTTLFGKQTGTTPAAFRAARKTRMNVGSAASRD